MNRNYLFFLLFFAITGLYPLQAQNKIDTIPKADTTINLHTIGTSLHLNRMEMRNMPFLMLSDFGLMAPSAYRLKGGQIYSYGIQTGGNNTFVDGMAVSDASDFPVRALESYTHYTKQAPIDKGFAAGSLSTLETPQQLDDFTVSGELSTDYAFNMQAVNGEIFIGIPLVSSKRKTEGKRIPTLIISGKYRWTNNTDPVWKQPKKLKQAVLDSLSANPLRSAYPYFSGSFPSAAFVSANDFVEQKIPDNAGKRGIYPYVKLFLPVINNASLTLGNYSVVDEKDVATFENSLFNAHRNGIRKRRNYDSYLRWNQQFTINKNLNIAYEAGVQYANHFKETEDKQFGIRFFDYGYIGKFTTYKTPTFARGSITIDGEIYNNVEILNSWDYDTLVTWKPAGTNPEIAAYTQNVYDFYKGNFQNTTEVRMAGGLLNGDTPGSVYGLWTASGTPSSTYEKSSEEKIRAYVKTKITYKNHHFLLGGEYNRETKRQYTLTPNPLWSLMRGLTDFHIKLLDLDNPIPVEHDGQVDTVIYNRKYDAGRQKTFDKNLRKALGLPVNGLDFILIDSYDKANNRISYYDRGGNMHTINTPENLFDLKLFSAEELLNGGNSYISYTGYDYRGNKIHGSADPYAFFKDFTMNAEKPEYGSAYVQDEFRWKNVHIRLGLRVDVYDARHPVLKDKYSLLPAYTVEEAQTKGILNFNKPDNIGNDYVVYVDKINDPEKVAGYRHGDSWFDALGNEIRDPTILNLGAGVAPYLKNPEIWDFSDENWQPEMTFQSYKKAINLLPQISLDYNLTKRLNLYFNYSSFTANPTAYSDFCPDAYQYWTTVAAQNLVPNPDLKPMRTGKLFAGVKGVLWKNLVGDFSFVRTSIDGYWMEKYLAGAYPMSYATMVNAGHKITTNGFQATLQWVNSAPAGIVGGMSLVKLFPNKEDENFYQVSDLVFNSHMGYRFGNENSILKRVSVTLYYQFRHGIPYIYAFHNGVFSNKRTPLVNLFNLNLQKEFSVGKRATLLAYLTVENLFNFKNVFTVYPNTGSAIDDGYLSDPLNQNLINNELSPDSYRFLYQQHLYNPQYYGIPRTARFGVILRY